MKTGLDHRLTSKEERVLVVRHMSSCRRLVWHLGIKSTLPFMHEAASTVVATGACPISASGPVVIYARVHMVTEPPSLAGDGFDMSSMFSAGCA